jgi:magnesium transporter
VDALRQGVTVRPGADGIVYEVLDRTVDAILPEVNLLSDRLDAIQQEVLTSGGRGGENQAILAVRSRAGQIRRLLTPQLTVMQRLSRGEFKEISVANRIYFRDIYDHMVRVDFAMEGIREDAEVVMSTYLTALNNRLSEVMKVLTVVGALALPAVVIAGIFGTNFDNVPGLHSNWGFAVMIAAMAGLAGGMALYFRSKGWF